MVLIRVEIIWVRWVWSEICVGGASMNEGEGWRNKFGLWFRNNEGKMGKTME